MSLWKIAWRSITQRGLSSTLTGLSMALGVALVIVVLVVYGVINDYFMQGAQGFHLIVGAKGSKQQLVFNTIYHLDQPIENIPYSYYKEFVDGKFSSATRVAVPFCLGDSYVAGGRTFRVVGTTPAMFDQIEYGRHPDGTPKHYAFQPGGRNFESEHFFEAVIGSVVARETGLKVNDTFRPSHGIVEPGDEAHTHDEFTIVGVLEPTGTPNDRAMFVNIEGFYLLEDHAKPAPAEETKSDLHDHDGAQPPAAHEDDHGDHAAHAADAGADPAATDHAGGPHGHDDGEQEASEHHDDAAAQHDHNHQHEHGHDHDHDHAIEPLPEAQREVTAVLVLLVNDLFSESVYTAVNEGNVAQAVFPAREIAKFFATFLGPVRTILLALTVLIIIVAGIGILVSIYNSMSERRREIAIMRALGASRHAVMLVILLESILLAAAGGIAGCFVGHGILGLISPSIVARTGVSIGFLHYDVQEVLLIPALIVLAAVVGFLPALSAYRTDVAESLKPVG